MIISKIYGGIGNQIWMYAYGLSQAIRLGAQLKLDKYILDVNPFNYTPYDFELKHFKGITEEVLSNKEYLGLKLIEESKFDGEIQNDSLIDGYWQNEIYFENIKDELRKKLIFKDESIKNVNDRLFEKDSVFIHARRGDYLNGDYFVDLSKTDYYQKSIEYILSKIENATFYIFSNDTKWAKEYFSFIKQNKSFEEGHNTIEDLYLMSQCSHSITANSTFSWWAAWLNNNPNKIVIQPKQWYGQRLDFKDLYFKDSIIL